MKTLHTDERFGVIIAIIVAAWVGFYFATPASLWFSVSKMDIQDAQTWREVTVDFGREINTDFPGEWFAKVRRKDAQGWVTYATTPITRLQYQNDSQLPDPVTLEWLLWTEPRAYMLPCGEYEVTITWAINPTSWFLNRDISRQDTFNIWGSDKCIRSH